ncbi:HAD family phosphatase [Vibrio sp. SCSIO 43136]|uniref:HAD family hydrolase n=1 Tax=Vibrio sp. SCSIO 43136 TaxID=2819101 RepID=UPI0020765666|nr:HAD family phosphatase [Vibrio sp. SCSIO 43136]USD67352.1 HAD family phosphatase [Vibrio sp. SCSIO 43136]
MLKAVLFDMDGLIFDTESIYKLSWQHAAAEQNLNLTDTFYQQFIGVKDAECEQMLAQHFHPNIDMAKFTAERDRHFHQQRQQGIALKPGFTQLLNAIKAKGLATAIITSSKRDDVEHNFANTPYLSQFDLLITAEDVEHGKPAPDGYLLACKHLGLPADHCLVLEDSNNGVKAGHAAGCHVIMVPDLLPPLPEIGHKTTVCDSLKDVIDWLDRL